MSRAQTLSTYPNIVTSGTYAPTVTGVTNVASGSPFTCQYMRVGSVVTVAGAVQVFATANGAITFGVSLPVASNFAGATSLGGTCSNGGGTVVGSIAADATNKRATFNTTGVTAGSNFFFTFTYLIV